MSPSIICASSNLYCEEDNSTIFAELESEVISNPQLITPQSDYHKIILSCGLLSPLEREEFLDELFQREIHHMPCTHYLNRFRIGELDSNARTKAIDWITEVHSHYNFGPLTSVLSINYMDRFLSTYQLPKENVWMMQLVAVACLSLAAKMEEIQVPLSLDFQIGKPRFVFEAKTIQEMELLVLSTLEWRMQSVTPFSFLDYFLHNLCGDQMPPISFFSKATQLITSTTRGIELLEFRASEIAAAVTILLAVETQIIQLDIHKATDLLSGRLNKEAVIKCVEMLKNSSVSRMDADCDFSANSKLDCSVLNTKKRKLV